MRLRQVTIEGYRSIRERIKIPIDRDVTVLLGANDHGKSNILRGLQHLNSSESFTASDLNWDCLESSETLPFIEFEFSLREDERRWLFEKAKEIRAAEATGSEASATPDAAVSSSTATATATATAPKIEPTRMGDAPKSLILRRKGVAGKLVYQGVAPFPSEAMSAFITEFVPRVEFITPFDNIPDSTTHAQLATDDYEFMRGIFYYAGIPESAWEAIFDQNLRTIRSLREASDRLNTTLRASWRQGEALEFVLVHDSAQKAVELLLKDPSVKSQDVHASQRSSGFTHFFALKTILFARQQESKARSYIWLFDEPGIYLHPAGQHDLIQAIEALAQHNQVLYSTHSIFLVNKNYPTRHRLIVKAKRGTVLDAKPYSSGWHPALQALGLSLPGTILFASHVLLTEGESEPILLYGLLQKAVEAGWIDSDLNPLGIVATGDARNGEVLLRILWESRPRPKIAFLFDGDRGGSDRFAFLKKILTDRRIVSEQLLKGTTIEDHLPVVRDLYVRALARYLASLGDKDEADLQRDLSASYEAGFGKSVPNGIAAWGRGEGQRLLGLESDPSPAGVAREYVELLRDYDLSTVGGNDLKRGRALIQQVAKLLDLPPRTAPQDILLHDEP